MFVPYPFDQLFDCRQHAGDNLVDTGRRGMNSIRLIEIGIRGDAIEKKRIKGRAINLGKLGVDRVERLVVFGAEIGSGLRAREQRG